MDNIQVKPLGDGTTARCDFGQASEFIKKFREGFVERNNALVVGGKGSETATQLEKLEKAFQVQSQLLKE